MSSTTTHDVITMGRSSIDLYANQIGAPFEEISSFAAYVGGSPTNIGVGTRRLGLETAILTAIGDDPVGAFIRRFLDDEGIDTSYIPTKNGRRSSAVVLGIEPPDRFPLVYYRENCADIHLDIDDVIATPVSSAQIFEFAGTNLSRDPARSATIFAAEKARAGGARVVMDLDFRPDQWDDPRAFGAAVRSALHLVDIVLGTQDEINASVLSDVDQMRLTHSQVSDTKVEGDTRSAIQTILNAGPAAVVEKRGRDGACVHLADGEVIDAPGYPVEVHNILGAGDAFAAGFIFGQVRGWDWRKSARLGNACGAIVVMSHGCANFMPTLDEVEAFVGERGGL